MACGLGPHSLSSHRYQHGHMYAYVEAPMCILGSGKSVCVILSVISCHIYIVIQSSTCLPFTGMSKSECIDDDQIKMRAGIYNSQMLSKHKVGWLSWLSWKLSYLDSSYSMYLPSVADIGPCVNTLRPSIAPNVGPSGTRRWTHPCIALGHNMPLGISGKCPGTDPSTDETYRDVQHIDI